jgi:hypothetical protein
MRKKLIKICAAFLAAAVLLVGAIIIFTNDDVLTHAARRVDTIVIRAEYNCTDATLTASQTMSYKNRTGESLSQIAFHLHPNAYRQGATFAPVTWSEAEGSKAFPDGKSYGNIEVKTASVNGTSVDINVGGVDENILFVALPNQLLPGKRVNVSMDYVVQLAKIRHRLGYTDRVVNLGNFYPVPSVFENGSFNLHPYSANGDPFYNELFNFDVQLTVDKGLVVAAGGTLKSEKISGSTKTVTFQSKAIRDFAAVLSREFKSVTRFWGKVAVSYFYLDCTNPSARLTTAVDSLETFSRAFVKYPYRELVVVQTDFLHGGMEFGTLVYISSDITDAVEQDHVIIHEIAHQWWYGIIGNNQIRTAWIDEGLAEYSTLMFYEMNPQYGMDAKAMIANARKLYNNYIAIMNGLQIPVDRNMNRGLNEFSNSQEYVYLAYVRGMLLFADLETLVGQAVVRRSLRDFARDNAFGFGIQESLVRAFERNARVKLGLFFDSYVGGKAL